jgi:spore maturation protein CgeB
MANDRQSAEKQAAVWNALFPIGVAVVVKLPAQPGEIERRSISAHTASMASVKPLAVHGDYWIAVVALDCGIESGLNSVTVPQSQEVA